MISQTAEYALRAMVCLTEEPELAMTGAQVAQKTQVPPGYLHKIMKQLVQSELLTSQRGPSGGFRLARPCDEITLFDVIQAVDPIKRITRCPLNNPEHCTHLCPLHQKIDDALAHISESFQSVSLQDLVQKV